MNKIQQWDLRVCRVCLLHPYNRPQASISRFVSRTGDGPLYGVLAALLWWQGESGRAVVQTALWAFALELPLYLLLKNALRRQRRRACLSSSLPPIATACHPVTRRRPS